MITGQQVREIIAASAIKAIAIGAPAKLDAGARLNASALRNVCCAAFDGRVNRKAATAALFQTSSEAT